jgi:hypothetical protein
MQSADDQQPINSSPGAGVPSQHAAPTLRPSLAVRYAVWLIFALAWTVALLVPAPTKGSDPRSLETMFTVSKVMHVGAYAVFAALAGWARPTAWLRWLLLGVLIGHAMLTEYLQMVLEEMTGRTGQWSDVGLDCVGIAVGVLLTWKSWFASQRGEP